MTKLTIRQKLNRSKLTKETRVLRDAEIISDHDTLTDLGRRVVLDYLWSSSDDLRKQIFKDIQALEKE